MATDPPPRPEPTALAPPPPPEPEGLPPAAFGLRPVGIGAGPPLGVFAPEDVFTVHRPGRAPLVVLHHPRVGTWAPLRPPAPDFLGRLPRNFPALRLPEDAPPPLPHPPGGGGRAAPIHVPARPS